MIASKKQNQDPLAEAIPFLDQLVRLEKLDQPSGPSGLA